MFVCCFYPLPFFIALPVSLFVLRVLFHIIKEGWRDMKNPPPDYSTSDIVNDAIEAAVKHALDEKRK